jgi:Arm DNA-binding domain/Phage integrase family
MAQVITTDASVRAARPKTGQTRSDYSIEGVPGLRLRVTSTGSKTFRLESRRAGKVTLGSYPAVSLADARKAANILIAEADRAAVNGATGTKVLATADRRTLGQILNDYEVARAAALSSWREQRRSIEYRYDVDSFISKLTRDVMLKPVRAERTVAAKRACRFLSTVLRWADAGHPIPNSELDDLVPEVARERVLNDEELKAVIAGAGKLTPLWRDFTLALIYSMKRRKDVAESLGDHFDLKAGIWACRVHKTKGAGTKTEAHPMSDQLATILKPRIEVGGPLFVTDAGQPMRNNFDRSLKRLHKESGTSDWTWHDLRRTSRTIMGREGVRPDIAERCMSHQLAGASRMSGVYDMYDYGTDMRAAYQALADSVDRIAGK